MRRDFKSRGRVDASKLGIDIEKWNGDMLAGVFDVIWSAYECLRKAYKRDSVQAKDLSEDEITSALLLKANYLKNFSSAHFRFVNFFNQPPDKSTPRNRKSKTNDIGIFFGSEHEKPEFIFEAKKIERSTEAGLGPYFEDLDAFLDEEYASHLSESGLIAYLIGGTPTNIFKIIKDKVGSTLKIYKRGSAHKMSQHKKRAVAPQHVDFVCHHLVFDMR